MTDTKLSSHLRSSSSHLENLAEADERGVASAQDLKSVPEEDMDNPQVGLLNGLPQSRTMLITTAELVFGCQTFHLSNHLLLHVPSKCQFKQLYRRDAGYNQGVWSQSDPGGAASLLQRILVRRWEYFLGPAHARHWKATSLPSGDADALHDECVV